LQNEGATQDVQGAIQAGLNDAQPIKDNNAKVEKAAQTAAGYGITKGFDEAKQARVAATGSKPAGRNFGILW